MRRLPSLRLSCVLSYSVVVSTLTRYVRGLGSDPSRDTKVHLCYATGADHPEPGDDVPGQDEPGHDVLGQAQPGRDVPTVQHLLKYRRLVEAQLKVQSAGLKIYKTWAQSVNFLVNSFINVIKSCLIPVTVKYVLLIFK